jgi:integrase
VAGKILTDAAVRKLRPGAERRAIRDGATPSLYLIIEPSGHKSWRMRFRTPSGRIGKLTLGPYDATGKELTGEPQIGQPLSLVAARQLAAEVHRQRAMGRDVIADAKARRHRLRGESIDRVANGFAAAARQYVEEAAKPKLRRWPEVARILGLDPATLEPIANGLADRWGDRPVSEIDEHDVFVVVDEARRVGTPGAKSPKEGVHEPRARSVYAALSAFFTHLRRQRRVAGNPCSGVFRPKPPQARDRVLSSDEIRSFWKACDAVGEPFASMLKLLLLTGQRLNEVAGMRRDELSYDGMWLLPGSRTKNKRAHKVPLPSTAKAIVAAVPAAHQIIFSTNGRTPPSGWTRAKRRLDAAMGSPSPWHIHDLRRTFVTGLVELGVAPHVVELIVNHVGGTRGGVAGVYNRSELIDERRAALERWAVHVHGIVSGKPTNVTPIRRDAS